MLCKYIYRMIKLLDEIEIFNGAATVSKRGETLPREYHTDQGRSILTTEILVGINSKFLT